MNKQPQEWTPGRIYSYGIATADFGVRLSKDINAALAAKDHTWNLVRLKDIKEVTDKAAKELNAEREKVKEVERMARLDGWERGLKENEKARVKPLVEALELIKRDLIAEGRYFGSDLESIIENALAKVNLKTTNQ